MTSLSSIKNDSETDPLKEKQISPKIKMASNEKGSLEVEPRPPPKWYSVMFWMWALTFWVAMLIGALHGLIVKGPVALYEKRQEWEDNGSLEWWGWLILGLIIVFFAYCEGYRGFQLAWSPMLVKRAYHFSSVSTPIYNWTTIVCIDRLIDFILAPLLAAGHICGTIRRLALSWGITIFVISLICSITYIPEDVPWKSFIDIGVVIGLGWGLVFILVWWFKVGILNKWPDWVRNEYTNNLVVRLPENILTKSTKKSSSTEKLDNSLNEVISVPNVEKPETQIHENGIKS